MVSRHQSFEAALTGRTGARFLAEFLRRETGKDVRPGAVAIALPEYGYASNEIPPGNKTNRMWLDVYYVIKTTDSDLTVGVEVKTSREDLLFGEKLHYEIGVADYLFLAVPRSLIPEARYVIEDQRPEDVPKIGLLDLTSGDIVIVPQKDFRKTNLAACQRNFIQMDMTDCQRAPGITTIQRGKLLINREYRGLLARPVLPKPPPAGRCFTRYQQSPRYQKLIRPSAKRARPTELA